ncbi:MAG: glycosyltransferase family 39 protein [Chloroflexi bacterium]|nr:glycosyltransferase family 39 protein [Chloroflexota bacterium]
MSLGLGVGVVLSSFGLRLLRLADKDLWWDEGWSIWLARHGLSFITLRTASDEHPPLHYWFLHFWNSLVGESEFAVRFSSVIFAVLTVALINRLVSRWVNRRAGILASFLLATARFHIWWSQEIKMYSLAVFLALLSIYLFTKVWKRANLWLWVVYVVATLAALYTSYLTFFLLLGENLAIFILVLLRHGPLQRLKPWLGAQFSLAFFYLPWLYIYYTHALSYKQEQASLMSFSEILRLYATILPLGVSTYIQNYTLPTVFFLVVAGSGLLFSLISRRRWEREAGVVAVVCLLALPLGIFLLSQPNRAIYQPKILERYFIIFVPLYSFLLAQGLRAFWRWQRGLGIVIALAVLMSSGRTLDLYYKDRHRTYDFPALASFVLAHAQPGDAVVLNPDHEWPVFDYFLEDGPPRYSMPYAVKASPQQVAHYLGPLTAKYPSLWLVTTPHAAVSDPWGEVRKWLVQYYSPKLSLEYNQARLELFSRDVSRVPLAVSSAKVEERRLKDLTGITLMGFDGMPRQARAGDTIYLNSYWQGKGTQSKGYKVGLRVTDDFGRIVAGRAPQPLTTDGESLGPPGTPLELQRRLTLGPNVSAGTYRLQLVVEGAEEGATIPVTNIRVEGSSPTPPARLIPPREVRADLGDKVRLLGYKLSTYKIKPGGQLSLTLYWRTLKEMDTSYTVFVHLVDKENQIRAQRDMIPLEGRYATLDWIKGEIIRDRYLIYIPDKAEAGVWELKVGMYNAASGERLPVVDKSGQSIPDGVITLTMVQVVP